MSLNSSKLAELVGAMVLSAGLGTRLGDLGRERPKALLPLGNVPLARWALALLAHHGLREVTLNVHHLAQQIRAALGDGERWGLQLRYSTETKLLGTGGGVKAMAALGPRRTQVIVNGKLATDLDLGQVLAFHQQKRATATMVLYPQPNAAAWGAVGIDASARVVRLLDARLGDQPSVDYMFTGIQVVEPELLDALPLGPSCIVRAGYMPLLVRGAPLFGFVHRGYFYEHSTPSRYLQGNLNLLQADLCLPAAPGPLSGVDPRAEIASSARLVEPLLVGAARVGPGSRVGPGVVIGDGVSIEGGARLTESVVWPDAVVAGSWSRAIISPTRSLRVPPSPDPMAAPR